MMRRQWGWRSPAVADRRYSGGRRAGREAVLSFEFSVLSWGKRWVARGELGSRWQLV